MARASLTRSETCGEGHGLDAFGVLVLNSLKLGELETLYCGQATTASLRARPRLSTRNSFSSGPVCRPRARVTVREQLRRPPLRFTLSCPCSTPPSRSL